MTKPKLRSLVIGLFCAVMVGWIMGQYDYARLVAGDHPLFARFQLHLADGGSVHYLGLGYTVTDKHEMRWGIEMQPDARVTTSNHVAPFRVGVTLDYWTPFISREHTRFIVETNR